MRDLEFKHTDFGVKTEVQFQKVLSGIRISIKTDDAVVVKYFSRHSLLQIKEWIDEVVVIPMDTFDPQI